NKIINDIAISANDIGHYLFEELQDNDSFSVSHRASQLTDNFLKVLEAKGAAITFRHNIDNAPDAGAAILLTVQWVSSYLAQEGERHSMEYLYEVAALLLYRHESAEKIVNIDPEEQITGLAGAHLTIVDGI